MKKMHLILFISIIIVGYIIIFQAVKIKKIEQNLLNIINLISFEESDFFNPMVYEDELTTEDLEIFKDLVQHKELIPFEGVLGGTPFYCNKVTIHKSTLTSGYVIIDVEDGLLAQGYFYAIQRTKTI